MDLAILRAGEACRLTLLRKAMVLVRRAIGQAGLGVFIFGNLHAGQAGRAALGHVGGDMHLLGQGQHVGRQLALEIGI